MGSFGDTYITIVDISSSTAPTQLANTVVKSGTNAFRITVAGKYAYIGTNLGIEVVDISSSTNPYGVRFVSSTNVQELVVSGKLIQEARKLIQAEAKIERGPVVIAEATGKLLRIK